MSISQAAFVEIFVHRVPVCGDIQNHPPDANR
jgi:hypothetical protein